jgi:uncharacterized membrane protein
MKHDSILKAAVTGVLALSGLVVAGSALATDDNREQCAGIAKAGKNDCATSANACHGHATADATAEAWIYLPKGTCDRIAGAHIVHVKDPTPKK